MANPWEETYKDADTGEDNSAPWKQNYSSEAAEAAPWTAKYAESDAQTTKEAPKATKAPGATGVLSSIKSAITPRLTAEEALDPKLGATALTFGLAGGAAGGPGGAIFGVAATYLMAEGEKREFEKFKQMGQTDEDARRNAAISTTVLSLIPGLGGSPKVRQTQGEFLAEHTPTAVEPEPARGSSVDLGNLQRLPRTGSGSMDTVRELAGTSQTEQLLSSKGGQPQAAIPQPPGMPESGPVQHPGVTQLPTGSVARPQRPTSMGAPELGRSEYLGSELEPLSSGSLIRHKADALTAQKPFTQQPDVFNAPELPALRKGPRESPVENPRVDLSAEEILQRREAEKPLPGLVEKSFGPEQQARYDQHRRQLAQERIRIDEAKREFFANSRAGNDLSTLRSDVVVDAGQGTPGFYDSLKGSTSGETKLPGAWVRASTEMHREMGNTGVIGRDTELVLHEMVNKPERMLDEWKTNQLVPIFDKWVGRAGWFTRNNPLKLPSTTKEFNMSKKDVDEFIDYAYTGNGRYGKVLIPSNPKIKGLVDELFSQGMLSVENHPGVRQAIIKTLEGDKPVGEPGQLFYPHNPQSPALKQGMTGKVLNLAFEQAQNRGWKGYTYYDAATNTVKTDNSVVGFKRWMDDHPANSFRRFNGLELGRTLDATLGGTARPSKVLKDLGYGTDPANDLLQWAHGTLRRGEQILAEPTLMKNWSLMHDELVKSGQNPAWLDTMIQRATGHDIEMADKFFGDWVSKLNNATNLGLLKLSGIQQINQASYIYQRFGLASTVRGLLGLPGPQRDKILHESGARVATYLQMMTKPTDPFGSALQRQLQVIGMTQIDMALRESAALAGDLHIRHQLNLFTNPAVKRSPVLQEFFEKNIRGVLAEANFPKAEIDRIITGNELTMDQRLRYAQNAANFTQGRIGYRGQPAVLADWTSPMGRLTRNLKNFMFSNWVEDARALNEARKLGVPPMTVVSRAARGLVGAVAAGDLTNVVTHGIKDYINQTDTPVTPKWLSDTFGETAGFHVAGLVAGKGNIVASLLLASSDSLYEFMSQTLLPAAIALPARDFDKLVMAWSKGEVDYALNVISKYVYGGNIVPPPSKGTGLEMPKVNMGGK